MWNLKRLFFLTFLLSLFAAGVLNVQAQRACLPNSDYRDLPYWRADFVFTGLVEKFTADSQVASNLGNEQLPVTHTYTPVHNSVRFTVEKNYRGTNEKNFEITGSFNFKEGERYFVYALLGKDGKIYQLDNGECGRPPILLKDAEEDIEYAEDIALGKIGTRIYGFVYQDKQDNYKTQRLNIPLVGIQVTIKSQKDTFTTETDEKGKYIFRNIPVGRYEITAPIPKGMHEREIKNNWQYGRLNTVFVGEGFSPNQFIAIGSKGKPKPVFYHSDSYNFAFTSLSSIKEKVVNHNGKIPSQQFLWLFPVENGKAYLDTTNHHLWIDKETGKFLFDGIPKGKYRLVINRFNCHSDNNSEYGRIFFPGVFDEIEADLITIDENQYLNLKDFRLLPSLKERNFSGIVLAADKSPLINATVFMLNRNQKNPSECFSTVNEVKTNRFGRFQIKGYEKYPYQIRAYTETKSQNQPNSRLYSKMFEIPEAGNVENIELIVDTNY